MRVVLINAYYGVGSTGKIVKDISDYLFEKSIENMVLCSVSNIQDKHINLIGNNLDHKIHALLSRLTGKQGYYSKKATNKMLKVLDEFKPDVVHIHNIHSNFINMGLLFAYLAEKKIRTVLTLHDCYMFTGKCVHYTRIGCYKWNGRCGKCPNLSSGNPVWFFDRTKKMLSDKKKWYNNLSEFIVIGVSRWVTNEAKKSVLSCADRIETIYNWVETDRVKEIGQKCSEKNGVVLPEGKYIILSVASKWSEEKGLNDIYKLSDILDSNFCCVLIGECPKRKKVERENILYLGHISEKEKLSEIYKKATVYFHPSREETFGLVIAEAMSFGTPAIVYNSTACPELIGEGCGFVADPGDVEEVYRNICMIVQKGKEYYSDNCQVYVEKYFKKEIGLQKMYRIYSERV